MAESTNDQPKKLTLTQKFEAAEKEIETLTLSLTEKDEKVLSLESELTSEQEAKAQAESQVGELKQEIENLNVSAKELQEKFEALESEKIEIEGKEQDIEKRASARLAAMQAEIGVSPPLPTESGNGDGKPESSAKNLTGIEAIAAALKERNVKV